MTENREPQFNIDDLPQPEPQELEPTETEVENQEQAEREIREWAKATIQEWREKVRPDYVFVTETAAVPHGYILEEAWKNAYPDEDCPTFYRIDPRHTRDRNQYWKENLEGTVEIGTKKYFQKRIKKDNANIIVFDEGSGVSISPLKVDEEGFIAKNTTHSLGLAAMEIYDAYEYLTVEKGSVWVANGGPEESGHDILVGVNMIGKNYGNIYSRPTSKYNTKSPYRGLSEDEKLFKEENRGKNYYDENEFTLAGRIVKHPEQRKRAIKFVKQLRKIGKEAGQELRKEIKKDDEIASSPADSSQ